MLIARSVAPRSSAPASDVTSPASNAASTARPSTTPKSNRSALHSVGIGAFFQSLRSRSRKTTFADSQPRCAYLCEKCGLVQQPPLVFQQERFDLGQIHQRIGNR